MVHCSGGGQTKALHYLERLRVVKDRLLPVPPLFHAIQHESGTSWREMYQVFNMGHRMELYVPESVAPHLLSIAKEYAIESQVIGYVEAAPQAEVCIDVPYGKFIYK